MARRSRKASRSSFRITTQAWVSAAAHGSTTRSRPARATKASSRFCVPGLARAARRACRDATMRPRAMTMMVSQSAETSCMTWLENTTVPPFATQPADDLAHRARAHHVQAVGRLVEQHVARVVHQGARQRHLGPLAVREAGRAPIGDAGHVQQLQQFVGARSQGCAGQALQLAVVVDVLARGQPRVEAGDVRQDAQACLRAPAGPRRRRCRRS